MDRWRAAITTQCAALEKNMCHDATLIASFSISVKGVLPKKGGFPSTDDHLVCCPTTFGELLHRLAMFSQCVHGHLALNGAVRGDLRRRESDAGGHRCVSVLLFFTRCHARHVVGLCLSVHNNTMHTTTALGRLLGPVEGWTVNTL